jgi:hypothetical protein
LPVKFRETFRKPLAKNLEPAMPAPEIPHPILPVARFQFKLGSDEPFRLP